MANILKGKEVTQALNEDLKKDILELNKLEVQPCLAIIRLGENPDDIAYERGAMKRAETVGVQVKNFQLDGDMAQNDLLLLIKKINEDSSIHGVLLLRPLPAHMDDSLVRNALAPEKDADGITDISMAGVFSDSGSGYPPCTAEACIKILEHFNIDIKGKKAVVIGRSLVVGKPVAMMLLGKNATVTMCHTKTEDPAAVARTADILIAAAGKAGMIGSEYLAEQQTVIDVGINVDEEGNLCGDVQSDAANEIVKNCTPVPGGVGTVTSSLLMSHVVEAAKKVAEGKREV